MAKRISIINFKGGVGKTTFAFNFAAGLSRYHQARVLLVDMDHQSSLSIVCLGQERWQSAARDGATVNQVFSSYGGSLPGPEIIHEVELGHQYAGIDIVPAQLELDNTEIRLTGSLLGDPIRSEWDKRTLLCRWIEDAAIDEDYDYILFDCAPATKIVSQNAIAASHGYVVPVVPEAVMERGAPHLRDMIKSGIDAYLGRLATQVDGLTTIWVRNTELVGLVITRIQVSGGYSGYTNEHGSHLHSLQQQWGRNLIEPYVYQGTGVSEALSGRKPVYSLHNTQNIGKRGIDEQYQRLTNSLREKIESL